MQRKMPPDIPPIYKVLQQLCWDNGYAAPFSGSVLWVNYQFENIASIRLMDDVLVFQEWGDHVTSVCLNISDPGLLDEIKDRLKTLEQILCVHQRLRALSHDQ